MAVRTLIGWVFIVCITTGVLASPVIDVGDIVILPGETKTFSIAVTGGGQVQGLDFYIQIGDGGAANSGSDTKPIITNVDIIGPGTMFNASNTGQTNTFSSDLLWAVSTTTDANASAFLDANGLLAYVTVNAAGTTIGETYPLLLTGVAAGIFGAPGVDTDFAGVAAQITNGAIVPEPATLSLLALGGLAILRRRRRLGGDA